MTCAYISMVGLHNGSNVVIQKVVLSKVVILIMLHKVVKRVGIECFYLQDFTLRYSGFPCILTLVKYEFDIKTRCYESYEVNCLVRYSGVFHLPHHFMPRRDH